MTWRPCSRLRTVDDLREWAMSSSSSTLSNQILERQRFKNGQCRQAVQLSREKNDALSLQNRLCVHVWACGHVFPVGMWSSFFPWRVLMCFPFGMWSCFSLVVTSEAVWFLSFIRSLFLYINFLSRSLSIDSSKNVVFFCDLPAK